MSKLRYRISISADGFVAGPNQSEENPLGEGGERLHDWAVSLAAWRQSHDKQGGEVNESTRIMDDPPYHNDVFILTHHPREPVEMEGGTMFHFVTDGIERALERAKESADGQDVRLWGGAQVIQQYRAAGLRDEGGVLALYVERGGRTILSYVDDEGALATAAKALAEAVHAGA